MTNFKMALRIPVVKVQCYLSQSTNLMRFLISLLLPIGITIFHLSLHGEHTLYQWTVLENHIAIMGDKLAKMLSVETFLSVSSLL
mmetsp:Transcript_19669/g.24303  ORF Transcript_19669/g.24303 Transcript_19669/m.24303 type:complete len:85 (-) Transcript_19669:346-600(-)